MTNQAAVTNLIEKGVSFLSVGEIPTSLIESIKEFANNSNMPLVEHCLSDYETLPISPVVFFEKSMIILKDLHKASPLTCHLAGLLIMEGHIVIADIDSVDSFQRLPKHLVSRMFILNNSFPKE